MKRLCEESQGECRKALNLCEESQALCKHAHDLCQKAIEQRDALAEQCVFYEQVLAQYEALLQEHGISFESVFNRVDEDDEAD